jgi:hypothetical protein
VPVAVSVSEAPGTAHVLADQAAFLDVDNLGLQIQVVTDIKRNGLLAEPDEGQFGASALSPLGVVSCDLTP